MGPFKFYWAAIKLAVKHSFDHAQYVLFGLFLAVGVASYFIPKMAAWETFVSGWQAATFVLGSIVLLRLLLAPYWLYKEKADALAVSTANAQGLAGWQGIDPLRLDQAAWLWCGQCPESSMGGNHKVYLQFEKLKRAVAKRQLIPDWTPIQKAYFQASLGGEFLEAMPNSHINEATPVTRAALHRYSKSVGETPEF